MDENNKLKDELNNIKDLELKTANALCDFVLSTVQILKKIEENNYAKRD